MQQSRREFLMRFSRTAGCFVATASLAPLVGCSRPLPGGGRFTFPQGVASADPQPDAVILWTRVVHDASDPRDIELVVHVARDEAFAEILLEQTVTAEAGLDNTVRCFVDGLDVDSWFYYRFLAQDGSASRVGRTRTAPAAGTATTLTAAFFSCQHYEEGLFSAYRRLLDEDADAPDDRKVDIVIHVGDFIYESNNRGDITNRNDEVVQLTNADGSPRRFRSLPSKGPVQPGVQLVAESLEDYREHYRIYLEDPDLADARAAWPWVCTWDDHEFHNDAWQSFHPRGPAQQRKIDSNQAWFEYIPAALTLAAPGPAGTNPARDFAAPAVEDVELDEFDDDYLSREPNNLAAIGSMTIYRSVAWGDLVDLLLVDGRSYRGPRGIDTSIPGAEFITAAPVPAALIETQNSGRTANGGDPPNIVEIAGETIPNNRRDAPFGSLLGREQKDWLKRSLLASTADWKLLCNDVPLMRFGFDMRFREHGNIDDIWWADAWDGYPLERRELMAFIRDSGLTNVVSMAGDRHAHFAGLVHDDFDAADGTAVIPEFVGSAVSSGPRLKNQRNGTEGIPDLDTRVHFDGTRFGYSRSVMPSLNAWLLYGAEAAATLAETGDEAAAIATADPNVNVHLDYADTDGLGYCVARFTPGRLEVEFVTVDEPLEQPGSRGPGLRRRVTYSVESWSTESGPILQRTAVIGEPPLMGLRDA